VKRISVLILAAALALLLGACGSDDVESLDFEGSDLFQFSPSSASVKAGQEVEVTFTNAGALQHSWTLIREGADVATATEADVLNNASTGKTDPGESGSVIFTAPQAGTYQFICTVPGHAAAGMVGTLTVTP
jgi:nitrite reductase (NO-forming)